MRVMRVFGVFGVLVQTWPLNERFVFRTPAPYLLTSAALSTYVMKKPKKKTKPKNWVVDMRSEADGGGDARSEKGQPCVRV